MRKLFLILSGRLTLEQLLQPPFGLDIDEVFLTRYDSLAFIAFQQYPIIVLDCPPPAELVKVSLGIADSPRLEALAQLFGHRTGNPILILGDADATLARLLRDLDIESVKPHELAERGRLWREHVSATPTTRTGGDSANVLTADDVRALQRRNISVIAPTQHLTAWAREVADSLGMTVGPETRTFRLFRVPADRPGDFQSLSETIYRLASAQPDLLFILPPPLLPCFAEIFPSLRRRMVSSQCTWAEEGAFTGETSFRMLQDQGCYGAIVSQNSVYHQAQRLSNMFATAHRLGLTVFLQNPLARTGEYGIIPAPSTESTDGWAVPPGVTLPQSGILTDGLPRVVFVRE